MELSCSSLEISFICKTESKKKNNNAKLQSIAKCTDSLQSYGNNYYAANINITCEPNSILLDEWKLKTYLMIISGYKFKRDEYFNQLEIQKKEITSKNNNINLEIEKQQIRTSIIRQLGKLYSKLVGKPYNGIPDEIVANSGKLRYLDFFESIFEWNEMRYTFSPDFGGKDNYYMDYTGNDFRNFLRAKAARVIIPIVPDKELLFLYFLQSGQIWPGKNKLTPVHKNSVSVVNELKENKLIKNNKLNQDKWEIRIPTTMIYLQDSDRLPVMGHGD